MRPLLECVPNFSEGRDPNRIAHIADAVRSVDGAALLHIDASPAANRSVFTIAGEPAAVEEAAFRGIRAAAEVIDMRMQAGVHPRIGATDVCPFVPLGGLPLETALDAATRVALRVGEELRIPIYLYEHSAAAEHRRALPDIRKGHYEGLAEKMLLPDWAPDYGPRNFNAASGATVMGARDLLVAFNISLATKDVTTATRVAAALRQSGSIRVAEDGTKMRVPGLLPKVRAIGWYMADYDNAQVSMNLLDYRVTSPLDAFEACVRVAEEIGASVVGSELIGCMPEECLIQAGHFRAMQQGVAPLEDATMLVHEGIQQLKLSALKPFDPQQQVLEYALQNAGLLDGVG